MTSNPFIALAVLGSLATLAACGNSSSSDNPELGAARPASDAVSRVAIVTANTETFLTGSSAPPTTTLDARFYQSDAAVGIPLPNRSLTPGCTIMTGSEATMALDPFDDVASMSTFRTVSSGEALPLISPDGASRELVQDDDSDEEIRYLSPAQPGELATGSYISVPGDDITTIPDLHLPVVESIAELRVTGDVDGRLSADSQIEWQTPKVADAMVRLTFHSQRDNTANAVHVDCAVADKGSFELPDDVRTLMTDTRFPLSSLQLTRERYSVERLGELLIMMRARAIGSL